ncbi:uncharacterized protein LOC120343174 isoform X2 [Styela clava]
MRQGEMVAIGIDIGTTFLCVGVCVNGKVQIIPNEHEARLTHAYIAFTDEERLFGGAARHQAPVNLKNTLHSIKRLIGRSAADRHVRQHLKYVGYDVNADQNENCQIPITSYKNRKRLYPEQVTAMMIGKMKKIAEDHLEVKVKKAVLSVPAGFTDFQRQSTINAGKMAGFEEVCLMNEPTAAALAFAHDKKSKTSKTILIFDFGGGKLEISLFRIDGKNVEVIHHFGDDELGGEDFDNKLVQNVFDDFRQKGIDLSENKKILHRLRIACEKAKKNFSSTVRTRIQVDNLHNNEPFESVITIEQFEAVTADLFERVENIVNKTINFIKEHHYQVDEIVLIGGSSRIPKVRRILQDCFNGKDLNRTINPDEAVAYGAAVQAAILFNDKEMEEFKISNDSDFSAVTPSDAINEQLANQERDEAIRSFQNYIRSVQTHQIFGDYASLLTSAEQNEVNKRCQELGQMLNENQKNLDIGTIDAERRRLEDFIESLIESLEHKYKEEKRKKKQELRGAIQNFRDDIRSVKQHEIFKHYQRFLKSEDQNKIHRNCAAVERFLNDNTENLEQIRKQHSKFKRFVESMSNRLENQAQEEYSRQAKELHDAIQSFRDYVDSVQQHEVLKQYETVMTREDQNEIRGSCAAAEKFLDENPENLKQIRKQHSNFESFVESMLIKLKNQAQEEKSKKEQELHYAIQSFRDYIRSVQQHEVFRQQERFITREDQNEIGGKFSAAEKFLDGNPENLEQIHKQHSECKRFVESISNRLLENQAQEEKKKQEQELRVAIQSFRDYIRSVQQHEVFKQYERFMTPEDQNKIREKCSTAEKFFEYDPKNLNLKQIHEKHLKLEQFVERILNKLRQAQDAYLKQKREKEKEQNEAIRKFQEYIPSVEMHTEFGDYQKFLTPDDKDDIKEECIRLKKFLSANPEKLELNQIHEEHSKFIKFVESILKRLHQAQVADQEMKRKNEQERHKAIKKFEQYVHSWKMHTIFGVYQTFLAPDEKEAIEVECIRSMEFLSGNSEMPDINQIQSEKEKFQTFVEDVLENLQERAEFAEQEKKKEEQKISEEIQDFKKFIESVKTCTEFQKYERFLSDNDKKEVKNKCFESEQFLERNQESLDIRQISVKRSELEEFVKILMGSLEQKSKNEKLEKQRKEELNKAIENFQQYIRSVKEHSVFKPYEMYLLQGDKDLINGRCEEMNTFLNSKNLNMKRIEDKTAEFGVFVNRVLDGLKHKAQLDEQKRKYEEQKKIEEIQDFQKFIESVQSYAEFQKYEEFLSDNDKNEIDDKCIESKEFLKKKQKKLDIQQIPDKRRELEDFVKNLMESLKQRYKLEKQKKMKQEQKRLEVIQDFEQYINSVQDHTVFQKYEFLSHNDKEEINIKCHEAKEFLKKHQGNLDTKQINEKRSEFEDFVKSLKDGLEQKYKAHHLEKQRKRENERDEAIGNFQKFIQSVYALEEFAGYRKFLSPDDKKDVDNKCIKMNTFLSINPETLDIQQIQDKRDEFADFVKSSKDSLKQKYKVYKEKQQEKQNKLNKAIMNFQQYIQSVQTFEAFAEFEKFLSSEEKQDVNDRCLRINTFLITNRESLDINQVKEKRLKFENFVASMLKSLKQKSQLVNIVTKKEREKEQKKNEVIQNFLLYIRSVESHAEFKDFAEFLTSDDKAEINAKCLAMKEVLSNNQEKLSVEQIQDVKIEFEDFVADIVKKLKDREQEDQKQKLKEAIQNFQAYIQSVQELEEFAQYETYLTSIDINGIKAKCLKLQTFINENIGNLHFKQIEDKRAEFESFIQSIVTKLQSKAQMAADKIKQERRKKWDEANRNLRKTLDSVRTQITNRHLGKDFSQYIENIKRTCNQVEDWLQKSQKTITVEELESKVIEVEATLKNFWSGLKQEIQVIEADKQQQANKERKLTETRHNLMGYLDSIRQMCESEQIAETEYADKLSGLCNETEEWLKSEGISAESIQTKHEELQATVQGIKQSISKMKQEKEAEENLRQKAFDNMWNYIDEVQTKIATDVENDEFTRPHINRITESCEIVLEWVKKNYDRITFDTIISEQRNLRTTIEDIYDKMQASKTEAEEIFRQQALTAVHHYIDDVCKSLEAERETDKTIVQCIDTIYKHCTNVFKWTNENYHQITGGRILSEFDNLQKNVNDIFNVLQARKIEAEAERERQRAETIRKRAEVINNLRAHISEVRSRVVFKKFKNRLTEEDLRLIFSQCNIAERHIEENSDTIQLEVQYLDIRKMTEDVYKKLKRIDTLEKAEVARRQAEEQRKKDDMSQKVKSYIDRVQRLTVFEPLTSRLTKNDEARIQSECIKANQFLIAENLTSAEIEKKCRELEEYVQIIYKKSKTWEEVEAERERERAETIRKRAEVINNLRAYISDVKSLVVFKQFKNRLTEEDFRLIFSQCNIAERHIRENSDTIQLEVQYLDIRKMTEHVYKKLERIDTLEKAEVARRQAEERIKKAEMSQKLKNYIDRVQRLTVFEPLTSRLTKHDEDRIQSECIKANQFLIAENLTSAEIEKKCRELEEYVQIIYKKLETREEIANKCKDDLTEWNNAEESLSKCINYWKQLVIHNRGKDKITDKYFNKIVEMYTDAENWFLVSYKNISQKELRDKREDLETVASKILKSMQDEKQKRDRKIVREADECRMFISRVRSFAVFGEQRNKLTSEDIKSITRKCNELKGWLSSYPITEDEIEKQRTELIEFVERLRNRIKKEQQ